MARNRPYHPARRAWLRIAGAALPVALAGFVAMTPAPALAAARNAHQALSGGVLTAEAIRAGTVVPGVGRAAPSVPAIPSATILPNVRASNNGNQPANENPVAANPNNALQLESGANDYNCGSLQGFYNSDDGGSTWPHQHCMTLLSGKSGDGDPNVAYGLDGTAYILGIQAGTTTVIAYQKSTDN